MCVSTKSVFNLFLLIDLPWREPFLDGFTYVPVFLPKMFLYRAEVTLSIMRIRGVKGNKFGGSKLRPGHLLLFDFSLVDYLPFFSVNENCFNVRLLRRWWQQTYM